MSLSHLTVPHLRKASRLIKKKESFLAKVKEIEQELEALALYGVLPKTYRTLVQAKPARRKRKAKAGRPKKSAPASQISPAPAKP